MHTTLPRASRAPWLNLALLALVVLAGAALRFVAPGAAPPGLYHDEAFNGLDALDVLTGARPLYFPANNGREPLYIYLVALAVGALGREPLAVRLPAAVLGTLTIPAAYALARAWFPARRAVALLAAALVAFSFWPLHLSRIGFRVVALPLAGALLLAALGRWLQPAHPPARRVFWAALAGALLGASLYTYLAARLIPLALLLFALWAWSQRRALGLRAAPRELGAFALAALLVAAPLAVAAAGDPAILFGRGEQVSVFSPDINQGDLAGTLVRHTLAALGLFFVRGDDIPRHNLPGRPLFDPLIAVFFVVGLLWSLRQARREPGAALALIWTAVMLVPTALAEDAPHFLRAAGILPVALLLPALGLDGAARAAQAERRPALRALAALIVVASAIWTARDYFGVYAVQPRVATAFEAAAVALAREARAFSGEVYVAERFWRDFETLPFMLGGDARVRVVAGPDAVAPGGPALVLIWPHDPADPPAGYLARLPAGRTIAVRTGPLAQGDLEPEPYPLYLALAASDPPAERSGLRFAGGPLLLDGRVEAPAADRLRVTLTWYAPEPVGGDYTAYVHAFAGETFLAPGDAPPGGGYWPTSAWRPGEVVRSEHTIQLPPGAAAGPGLRVRVGLYGADGTRLQVVAADGAPVGDGVDLSGP